MAEHGAEAQNNKHSQSESLQLLTETLLSYTAQ